MPVVVHVTATLLELLGLVAVIGAIVTQTVLMRGGGGDSLRVRNRIGWLIGPALLTLTLGVAMVLAVRTSMMSGEQLGSLTAILPVVLQRTHFGLMWLIRCTALLLLWVAWALFLLTKKVGLALVMFFAAAVVAWTISGVGHSAGVGGFEWRQWVDWIHVMAISLWGGSMLIAAMVLTASAGREEWFATTVNRLSSLAGPAFAVVLVSGIVNTEHQLHSVGDFITTAYGRILLVKLVLVAAMLACASANRFIYLPRLNQRARHAPDLETRAPTTKRPVHLPRQRRITEPAGTILRLLRLETLFMIAVLVCVAMLRHGPPPPHHMQGINHHSAAPMATRK